MTTTEEAIPRSWLDEFEQELEGREMRLLEERDMCEAAGEAWQRIERSRVTTANILHSFRIARAVGRQRAAKSFDTIREALREIERRANEVGPTVEDISQIASSALAAIEHGEQK